MDIHVVIHYGFPIIKAIKENEDVIVVEVHYYVMETHSFNGVYKPKMVVDKQINKKRNKKDSNINRHCTNLLKLEDVYILVYDLNLTKKGTLHFRTMEIIKRLLPQEIMLIWEFIEPNHRSRRLLTSEMVGIMPTQMGH